MTLIDADAHVIESEATWAHLEPRFHSRRPVPVTLPEDTVLGFWNACYVIDGKMRLFGAVPTSGKLAREKSFKIPSQELSPVAARLHDLDRLGIEKQVIHPSFCLLTIAEDPLLEGALMRSYNTFLAEKCRAAAGRLWADILVPWRDTGAAIAEIRRVKALGYAVCVMIRGIEWDRPISDPSFYPIYEECERQGLAIAVHLGHGSPTIQEMFRTVPRLANEDPFFPPRLKRVAAPLTVQYGFYSLMESSLATDFPKLRWAFLEAGGSEWAISALSMLERSGKANCKRVIDEGRVFLACESNEDLNYVASRIGADCLVVASDMPHFDESAHGDVGHDFTERKDLAPAFLDKIFMRNAMRLYDFTPPAHLAAAAQ